MCAQRLGGSVQEPGHLCSESAKRVSLSISQSCGSLCDCVRVLLGRGERGYGPRADGMGRKPHLPRTASQNQQGGPSG